MLKTLGFTKEVENNEKGLCVFCSEKIKLEDFKDALSLKEFYQSGICQTCHSKTFREE